MSARPVAVAQAQGTHTGLCSCMLCLHFPACLPPSPEELCCMSHMDSPKLMLAPHVLSSTSYPRGQHVLRQCQGATSVFQGACMPQGSCRAAQELVGPA